MKKFNVKIDPEALIDIQEATNWYSEQQPELGERFQSTTVKQIDSLGRDPHIYAVRYKEIRCMIVEKFPFMVHFYINEPESSVEVLAVINTGRNPRVWLQKTRSKG
ncbi:MAG: type II toxin-antitoxin system RelE/ParE family toxin [Bacteroidales bacterium]|nr:type II toxin-antitoxin system RelE/ParE family toxin [Bacteroidales bacterium]